jgi:hypothetical protein
MHETGGVAPMDPDGELIPEAGQAQAMVVNVSAHELLLVATSD